MQQTLGVGFPSGKFGMEWKIYVPVPSNLNKKKLELILVGAQPML